MLLLLGFRLGKANTNDVAWRTLSPAPDTGPSAAARSQLQGFGQKLPQTVSGTLAPSPPARSKLEPNEPKQCRVGANWAEVERRTVETSGWHEAVQLSASPKGNLGRPLASWKRLSSGQPTSCLWAAKHDWASLLLGLLPPIVLEARSFRPIV